MVVGVFTAVPVTGSPRYDLHHCGPLATQQEPMLVFQPLQSGGRDVIFERRSGFVSHRFSERPLCSHLPICHGISCTCGWPNLRSRASAPMIPRVVNVTYAG